jgi:hypothetical protein
VRSPECQRVWLLLTIALAGCSPGATRGDAGVFVAAQYPPPDPCGLLTLADIHTVSPNASGMYEPDPADNGDLWMNGCQWGARPASESNCG